MTDVFISYARPDEATAEKVAAALRSESYQVWRDDELPAHRAYADVIEERLKGAKAVIVLWSREGAKSHWVRAEADAARAAGTLVQATLDGSPAPMPFNQIQCADLSCWGGEADLPGWRKLTESVRELTGAPRGGAQGQVKSHARERSICVLPFANMSGDTEQEYFSDGISEDITTDLSKVSALAVTARNTAFQFKGQSVDVCDVAKRLAVSHVLEGSVRKAGNRVRITAQLIDGRTGDHVWAERFDRELTDIFALQDELSTAIVAALRVKLLPEEKQAINERGTTSVEAYDLFLMGRSYWLTGNYGDCKRDERVIRLCQRAIEIDPEYAHAWALMALAQSNLDLYFGKREQNGLEAAERALSIDPKIAEAHCVRARYLANQGKTADADNELSVALQLDPESWDVNSEAGRQALLDRRIEEATRFFEKSASLVDSDFHSWGILLTCYRSLGEQEKFNHALRMVFEKSEAALKEDPGNGSALGMIALAFASIGDEKRAKHSIERALLLDPDNYTSRYNFACVLANDLRDYAGAIDMLETAFQQTRGDLIELAEADPDLDCVRDDPRFQNALDEAKRRRSAVNIALPPAGT